MVFILPLADDFIAYLKLLYKRLTPTHTSTDTWPPSVTRKYFSLAMIKTKGVRGAQIQEKFIRMAITGKVDDILKEKYPIQLKDILNETENKQKVILLQGGPGSGKSTLSVHISQQWGEDKLFAEFKYVILVRLQDPAVQAASCIADLLPARNRDIRQQAAKDIIGSGGEGVLFILDGWDNLPSGLRKCSIFCDMVKKVVLLKSSVIVTSRPIASGNLHQYTSTHIEILGFTPGELKNYFTECLNNDSKAVETLIERIYKNPAIASSCYLPMNASILAHLFMTENYTFPCTQYGIFSELVLSCIYRHHNERTEFKHITLKSLQYIPETIRDSFLFLCKLAYDGIENDRVIFSDLPSNVNTLGLLQGVESFVKQGTVSYNFLHLSIQEVLAGFYIATRLPDDEQVSKFNELFDKPHFSAVFLFFAAVTKLQTPGIRDVVVRVAKESNKTLLLSLFHCLYEAQDPSLCELVVQLLHNGLDLGVTTLTPSDCFCIGYFLSHAYASVCKVIIHLAGCSIGDQGCKYLASGLCKCQDMHSAAVLTMDLSFNDITCCGLDHLSAFLKVGYIENLQLGSCLISSGEHLKLRGRNRLQSLQGTFSNILKWGWGSYSLNLEL